MYFKQISYDDAKRTEWLIIVHTYQFDIRLVVS
jgi:hypothetical protein